MTSSQIPDRLRALIAPGSVAHTVGELFENAGHEIFLVGGSVRDAFLGAGSDDLDFTTSAQPNEIKNVVKSWADQIWSVGEKFGTIGLEKDGRKIEITTYRSDAYSPDSRKPNVDFGESLEVDLSRRDFTINAMALRVPKPELVDPFGGVVDLAGKKLRTPISPDVSFSDDPLRMMRAARFVAGLGMIPEPDLVGAIERNVDRLEIVSMERVRDELSKLLVVEDPSAGLWMLARTGLSDRFFPELNALQLEQDPVHHHKDVLAHTIAVVANTRPELRVRLAALMHDIGKPKTRGYSENGVTFHHHEVVGARMTEKRMRELKFPADLIAEVRELVYLHLRIHTYDMGWTDSAVRRYVRDAGPLLKDLNHLTRCDCTTRNPKKVVALNNRMDELEARIAELAEKEELAAIRPPLDGTQVMDFLQISPGPLVGEALSFLLEIRLDEGPIEEADAYDRLSAWSASRGAD